MKFKTQKEVKEETQDENKSNPIHEYLDFFDYAQQQLIILSINKRFKIAITTTCYNRENLEKYFSWIPNGNYTLITKGKSFDFIKIAYDLFINWIDRFNDILPTLEPYDAYVISQLTAPLPRLVGDVKQAYKDFQENPEEAEKKWFKCE